MLYFFDSDKPTRSQGLIKSAICISALLVRDVKLIVTGVLHSASRSQKEELKKQSENKMSSLCFRNKFVINLFFSRIINYKLAKRNIWKSEYKIKPECNQCKGRCRWSRSKCVCVCEYVPSLSSDEDLGGVHDSAGQAGSVDGAQGRAQLHNVSPDQRLGQQTGMLPRRRRLVWTYRNTHTHRHTLFERETHTHSHQSLDVHCG